MLWLMMRAQHRETSADFSSQPQDPQLLRFYRYWAERRGIRRFPSRRDIDPWPAAGSADTELGVTMEPEVGHGETEVFAGVQG